MKDYRAKTLFTGYKLGYENGKLYVGVPNTKGENVRVYYKSEKMTIKIMRDLSGGQIGFQIKHSRMVVKIIGWHTLNGRRTND